MMKKFNFKTCFLPVAFCLVLLFTGNFAGHAQNSPRVIAFFTAKNDLAHISFVHEANRWFDSVSRKHGFLYDSTSDWSLLNSANLLRYKAVIFLDTRPEDPAQRQAFEAYVKKGGGWMGFHFSAFALSQSAVPNNWNWYHDEFIGAGEYKSNTWHPTSAILQVEARNHPVTKRLPGTVIAAPNEWYSWQQDLKKNPAIRVLLSVDSSSFPLGNGPKLHEIWHSGYYPVVWTNTKYKMVYFNMGHNDMDYDHGTNRQLSSSFSSRDQNRLIENALVWVMGRY